MTTTDVTPQPGSPSLEQLANWFTYHPPQPGQPAAYERLRDEAHTFAALVAFEVPAGPEQDRAIEAIRNAVMWANAGIACQSDAQG